MTMVSVESLAARADAEQVTAEDLLHALCFKAIEDPKSFTADTLKDMVTTLGFAELWETAAEQVLMMAGATLGTSDDPDPDDELGEPEDTDPTVSADAQPG